jgi:hypothetical protein
LVGGIHGVLIDFREFSALRQAVLEKVLAVGGVRSCPYLVTKSSQVGIDADKISFLLHRPTTCG